ncbi:hypothetical protein AA313_de0202281 [Arthrobotrys entomopaga]|nr:hypothetical protein AA313_de0202281 [Arthrobotrys entomopaga]
MKYSNWALVKAILFGSVAVFAEDSLCDKYTKVLFGDNTGSNQYLFMTELVNTALIGNYTQPVQQSQVKVNGILIPGTYNGQEVSLLPFFNGGLNSTNRGLWPSVVNFLDDGAALPLLKNKPAYTETSFQYNLISHLYQYFGGLLRCSLYGQDGFPAYVGNPKMYEVHKYMGIGPTQLGYFIQEFGLAAASLGFNETEVRYLTSNLNSTFGQRCAPPTAVLPNTEPDLQAICLDNPCPVAVHPVCDSYGHTDGAARDPEPATQTAGPQADDLVAELTGETFTTLDVSITTTIDGLESVIETYTVVPQGPAPISFTTSVITVSTTLDGTPTVVPASTVLPIGGGVRTVGTETLTSSDGVYEQGYTSIIPSSVIEFVTRTITTNGSARTTTVPTTVPNTVLEPISPSGSTRTTFTTTLTSDGLVFTTVITTEVATGVKTSSPNTAPIQTAGPLFAAIVGAGLIGQML